MYKMPPQPVAFIYENHKGAVAARRALPLKLWYGKTDWYPEPQWFIRAWDFSKASVRDFALSKITGWCLG